MQVLLKVFSIMFKIISGHCEELDYKVISTTKSKYTLDFLISVGLRLLIFGIFSRVYVLIREPTLIQFGQLFFIETFEIMKTEKL